MSKRGQFFCHFDLIYLLSYLFVGLNVKSSIQHSYHHLKFLIVKLISIMTSWNRDDLEGPIQMELQQQDMENHGASTWSHLQSVSFVNVFIKKWETCSPKVYKSMIWKTLINVQFRIHVHKMAFSDGKPNCNETSSLQAFGPQKVISMTLKCFTIWKMTHSSFSKSFRCQWVFKNDNSGKFIALNFAKVVKVAFGELQWNKFSAFGPQKVISMALKCSCKMGKWLTVLFQSLKQRQFR